MSSQSSSIYDDPMDPLECFDKLEQINTFDDSNQQSLNDKTNKNQSDNQLSELERNGYDENYLNIENQHRLESPWTIWYSKLSKAQGTDDFQSKLQIVAHFCTVEQFWNSYCYLKRPHDLETLTELHVFKDNITPMYEHERNLGGGKFIMKFKKGVISRLWKNLLLSVLGEQFLVGDEITGVVLSIRHYFDRLCVWNSNSQDKLAIEHISQTLKRVLNLNENVRIDYKPFNTHKNNQNKFE